MERRLRDFILTRLTPASVAIAKLTQPPIKTDAWSGHAWLYERVSTVWTPLHRPRPKRVRMIHIPSDNTGLGSYLAILICPLSDGK